MVRSDLQCNKFDGLTREKIPFQYLYNRSVYLITMGNADCFAR